MHMSRIVMDLQGHRTPAMVAAAKLGGEVLLGFLEVEADEHPEIYAAMIESHVDWNKVAEYVAEG